VSDELRDKVRQAVLAAEIRPGSNALYLALRGKPIRLSGNEADELTEAIMAIIEPAPTKPPARPQCEWFHWIGQPFYSCDQCGRPAWEHKGRLGPPANPFGADEPETGIPWTDEERESCRRKWEPAMLAGRARRAAKR
jgi:hypothetical protein